MPRRLMNRSRPSGPDSSPVAPTISADLPLPAYQPPSCPLNDRARRALGELSNNHGTHAYDPQLKDCIRNLSLSVGDLHERLTAQQGRLGNLVQRRREKETDKTAEEERLETHLVELEKDVDELTQESETCLRDVIDHRAELQDHALILAELYTNAATALSAAPSARNARDEGAEGAAEDQDEKKQTPAQSTRDIYRKASALKRAEYEALHLHERYALNNDYAGFKKIWHDAAAGEDGPPLPDASRWFRVDGRPVMTRPSNTAANSSGILEAADLDDNDDIAVAREVLSLNCPLTLRQMEEPYSNAKCKHTFEKSAILDYLSSKNSNRCPQTGCNQTISKARFYQDFFFDEAMLRRIKRANQSSRTMKSMDDEDEEEDNAGNESLMLGEERRAPGRTFKGER